MHVQAKARKSNSEMLMSKTSHAPAHPAHILRIRFSTRKGTFLIIQKRKKNHVIQYSQHP
jgi:hypothetical protein